MLRGCRGWFAALGLAFFAVLAFSGAYYLYDSASANQARYETTAKDRADSYAHRSDVIIGQRCDTLTKREKTDCISKEKEAARQSERDEYDLEAQRVTATWTAHMGIAAIIGMAASLIGVGLIWFTFQETRNAANSAQISSEAYIWNERAWLEFTHWAKPNASIRVAPIDAFPKITIHNSGRSVAKILSATAYGVDSGWKKLEHPIKWPVDGRLVKAESTGTLMGLPIRLDVGEKKQFVVDVEYMILGGKTDSFECRFSMSLAKSNSPIGGFELEYSE